MDTILEQHDQPSRPCLQNGTTPEDLEGQSLDITGGDFVALRPGGGYSVGRQHLQADTRHAAMDTELHSDLCLKTLLFLTMNVGDMYFNMHAFRPVVPAHLWTERLHQAGYFNAGLTDSGKHSHEVKIFYIYFCKETHFFGSYLYDFLDDFPGS